MAILRIELLDDCNIVSGEAYNSYLKEDIFYDKYGLPYIPAWLIKNHLYDIAQSISDQKLQEQIADMFGINGISHLVLDDALIADRESLRQAIIQEDNTYLTDPQTILSTCNFTTVKKKFINDSVHYVRVLNKGLIFEQYFLLDEKYREVFEYCINNFKRLITDHEVGILCTIDWDENKPQLISKKFDSCKENSTYKLHYSLHILSKTCFDNHIETKAISTQYIPGYEIMKVLSEKIPNDFFETFFNHGDLKCSFAYRDMNGQRSIPVPSSYAIEKNDQTELRDRLSKGKRPDDFDQLYALSDLYINDLDAKETDAISVKMENGLLKYFDEGSIKTKKYQAISEGQVFRGFIEGSSTQINKLIDIFKNDGYIRLGNFTEIGLGNVYFTIDEVVENKKTKPIFVKSFNAELISPAALYNNNGLYQADANKIKQEFESMLGCKLELVKNYQSTRTLAKYNRNWNELAPMVNDIDTGSIFRFRQVDAQDIDISPVINGGFVGEHNALGFGEFIVRPTIDMYYRKLNTISETCDNKNFLPHVDPKPGRYLIRHLNELKLKTVSKQEGKKDAENCFAQHIFESAYPRIAEVMDSNPDELIVIEEYLDGVKEYCLNHLKKTRQEKTSQNDSKVIPANSNKERQTW